MPNWIGSQIDDSSVRSVTRIAVTMLTRASWKPLVHSRSMMLVAGLRDWRNRTAVTSAASLVSLPKVGASGRAKPASPESTQTPSQLDSGLAPSARPGMTPRLVSLGQPESDQHDDEAQKLHPGRQDAEREPADQQRARRHQRREHRGAACAEQHDGAREQIDRRRVPPAGPGSRPAADSPRARTRSAVRSRTAPQ